VTGTYDGGTFKLYVNGVLEAQQTETTTIGYTGNTWTIGSSPANIRNQGFPRTWNGVIDEVQVFSRALGASEIQGIINAGSGGECKVPALISAIPNTAPQGQQNISVALGGAFTNWVQGTTLASFGPGINPVSVTVNSPTSATAVVNVSPTAATGAGNITLITGPEIDSLTNGLP